MQLLRNALQMNRGDTTFSGPHSSPGWMGDWSWGPIFLDVDLDGYEDILITNGMLRIFGTVMGRTDRGRSPRRKDSYSGDLLRSSLFRS